MRNNYLTAILALFCFCMATISMLSSSSHKEKIEKEKNSNDTLTIVYTYDVREDEPTENVSDKEIDILVSEPEIEGHVEVITIEEEPIKVDEVSAMYIAKTVYGEARGCSKVEQAAVVWSILNRVDSDKYPDTIVGVVTQNSQFHGYNRRHPVISSIYDLTVDVMTRWEREKRGETNVGRVLPKEYLYFYGDGRRNHFRTDWRGGATWNWSLPNPYESEV